MVEDNSSQSTEKLVSLLESRETEEAVASLMELLTELNKSGLLDLLRVVGDSEVFHSLLKYLMNPSVLRIADRLDLFADFLDRAGEVLITEEKEKTGISGLLKALGDPEVQKGLTKAIKLLKLLGSYGEK